MMKIDAIDILVDGRRVTVHGRAAWALTKLLAAGDNGCSYVDHPAPRWSGYVHQLRGLGINIETIREAHGGAFPGHHARYVLRREVTVIATQSALHNASCRLYGATDAFTSSSAPRLKRNR